MSVLKPCHGLHQHCPSQWTVNSFVKSMFTDPLERSRHRCCKVASMSLETRPKTTPEMLGHAQHMGTRDLPVSSNDGSGQRLARGVPLGHWTCQQNNTPQYRVERAHSSVSWHGTIHQERPKLTELRETVVHRPAGRQRRREQCVRHAPIFITDGMRRRRRNKLTFAVRAE